MALSLLERERLRALLRSGDTITWGQCNGQPRALCEALVAERHHFEELRLFLGVGQTPIPAPEHADVFNMFGYCGAGSNRALVKAGVLDILPVHYSQVPGVLRSGFLRTDVVMLQVAPPDEQGRYSLGLAHDYLLGALDAARVVIGEVNPNVPFTFGERYLHASDFDLLVESDAPLTELGRSAQTATDQTIARYVAAFVEDGATLEMGLGALPEAILSALSDRRDLGVHSGTIGDAVVSLTEAGVITNARKEIDTGVTVATVLMGGDPLHRFAHRNAGLMMRTAEYTHSGRVMAAFKKFVALNSAIEVDLTGQINAEVAAGSYVGAVGGAIDFLRAAAASEQGVPIVALPSTAGSRSRIVARIEGPVSTARSDAGVFVTEFGAADLRGLPLSARVRRMLDIAHPDHRAALERDFYQHGAAGVVRP